MLTKPHDGWSDFQLDGTSLYGSDTRVQDICECSVSNLGDSNGVSRQGTIFPYNDCGCSRTT